MMISSEAGMGSQVFVPWIRTRPTHEPTNGRPQRGATRVVDSMHVERMSDQHPTGRLAPPTALEDAAAQVLEYARAIGATAPLGTLPPNLRRAIAILSVRARSERMTVERVIIQLKERWAALPEIRRLPRGGEHDAILACAISQCILDFYAHDDHPSADQSPD